MILPLLAALQLSAGVGTLVVRTATQTQRVPLVASESGPLLRPELLAPLVAVTTAREAPGRYRVSVFGVPIGIEVGAATVRTEGLVRQLAVAPVERDGHLLVPLQFVSDILPAFVSNVRWDAAARQLVILSPAARVAKSQSATQADERVAQADRDSKQNPYT